MFLIWLILGFIFPCFCDRNDEDFKVYVMMPLLPAFEGEFGTVTGVAIQAITHWNYASICRGGNSLIEKLSKSEGKLKAVIMSACMYIGQPLM